MSAIAHVKSLGDILKERHPKLVFLDTRKNRADRTQVQRQGDVTQSVCCDHTFMFRWSCVVVVVVLKVKAA